MYYVGHYGKEECMCVIIIIIIIISSFLHVYCALNMHLYALYKQTAELNEVNTVPKKQYSISNSSNCL